VIKSYKKSTYIKTRRKRFLYISILFLFSSGVILAYTFIYSLRSGPFWWFDIGSNLAWVLFCVLVAIMLNETAKKEAVVLHMLDWLGDMDSTLSGIAPPLNTEKLQPVGRLFTELLEENCGWVFLIRSPGLLIRGEMIRRKYLPLVEVEEGSSWNTGWVESSLKNEIERKENQGEEIIPIPSENGRKHVAVYKVSLSQMEDIAAGVAVVLGKRKAKMDPLVYQAFSLGVDMVVQRINSILMEVIHRRRGLGVENLGLVMRVLAHELNNDLQGAMNNIDTYQELWKEVEGKGVIDLRSNITRAGFWAGLMREAPFLVDEVLPFERNVISLNEALESVLGEMREAWPEVHFVIEVEDGIQVVGDHHIRSILRNLIHNAASYSPQGGSIKIQTVLKDDVVGLLVEDEGPGVDPDDVDKIFAPLESMREDRKRGKRADFGMGVGLTVSRAIARAYGGELVCHSNKEVSGGVFEVILPLARNEAAMEGTENE
jgi:anti-sigma regulatory factor (Ser/Thr protein kinase)